eukprot:TRINITY_DN3813_c0_g1_i1.p2 TRINITY_DN3813_c0_g1~~TRINITY_DN3813_c0_g1_i1.p2  ORF type:complete len:650 (-),score=272.32 TRINITY_DN3813_c0_g1_i1:302-2251(-)
MAGSPAQKRYAVGIDLGTTNSCIGCFQKETGTVKIFADEKGRRTTPSHVAFTPTGMLVGYAAREQESTNASNTIYDAKRLIGQRDKAAEDIIKSMKWPFKIEMSSGRPQYSVYYRRQWKSFSPEAISAEVLKRLVQIAENELGAGTVKSAVITVPAYFDESQKKATRDAAEIAGLEVLQIINEPTAAALAYGLGNQNPFGETILVFDLGGGTFDVTLLDIGANAFEVKAHSGDTLLGGRDFDNALMAHCEENFKEATGVEEIKSKNAKLRLRNACERAKIELSVHPEVMIKVLGIEEGQDLTELINQEVFELINEENFEKIIPPLEKVLEIGEKSKDEVEHVVMIGGSSRIPRIQHIVQDFFPQAKMYLRMHPDEAVAYGAAIQAALCSGALHDADRYVDTSKINPDTFAQLQPEPAPPTEVPELVPPSLLDVVPRNLGVGLSNGNTSVVIKSGRLLPTKEKKRYVTDVPTKVANKLIIEVFQGQNEKSVDNTLLCRLLVDDLPVADTPLPVFVEFQFDKNGLLMIEAEVEHNGKKSTAKTHLTHRPVLEAGEIERAKRESNDNAQQDRQAQQLAEKIDELKATVSNVQQQMTKLPRPSSPKSQQALEHLNGLIVDTKTRLLRVNSFAMPDAEKRLRDILLTWEDARAR